MARNLIPSVPCPKCQGKGYKYITDWDLSEYRTRSPCTCCFGAGYISKDSAQRMKAAKNPPLYNFETEGLE